MFILLVIIAIFFLNSVRQQLFITFIRICRTVRITPAIATWIYSLIFLPGTIVHELSHFLTASMLGLRTGSIELLPKISESGIRFGSVAVEKKDPFRSLIVGISPTIVGITCIVCINLIYQKFSFIPLAGVIWMYLTITIASHIIPSHEDLTYLLPFGLLTIIIIGIWWYLDSHSLIQMSVIINRSAGKLIIPILTGTGLVISSWIILLLFQHFIQKIHLK